MAQPGCPARAAFGEIEALASCFKRSGDDWISSGRVRVNGLDIVPLLRTDVVVNPNERTVSTRGLARVFAGESLLFEGSVSWKFDGGRVEFEAARAGAIHALPILGQVGLVTAGPGAFRVTLYPRLDPIFNEFFHQFLFVAGEHIPLRVPTGTGDLTLRSENASGVRFDGIRVDMSSLAVGTFELRRLQLSFDGATNGWDGALDIVLPGPEPRFMIQAELAIRDGRFARAAARVDGINTHIGYGVFLQRLGLDVRANPSFFEGTIGLSGGPKVPQKPPKPPIEAVSIDGAFSYLVADPGRLRVSGRMNFGSLPAKGDAKLEYFTTGRITVEANAFVGLASDLGITSHLAGFVDANRSFLLEGDVRASVFGIGFGGRGLVSNLGIAACGRLFTSGGKGANSAQIGFGYRWNGAFTLMGQSCDVGPYSPLAKSKRANAGQAGVVASLRLPGHLPLATFAVTGETAPPRVTIVGPGGRRATDAHRRQQPPPGRVRDPAAPIRPHDLHSRRQATRRPLEAAPRAGILRGQIRAHGVRAAGAASRGQGEREGTRTQASLPREAAPWAGRPLPRGGPTDRAPARANHSEPRGDPLPARRRQGGTALDHRGRRAERDGPPAATCGALSSATAHPPGSTPTDLAAPEGQPPDNPVDPRGRCGAVRRRHPVERRPEAAAEHTQAVGSRTRLRVARVCAR